MVFLAGGLPVIAVSWAYLLRRSRIVCLGLAALALATWTLFCGAHGGFTVLQGGLLSLELTTGLAFLVSLLWLWREDQTLSVRRMIGWFLVEFLFLQRFLVYPSGHHLLMLALPVTLLSCTASRLDGKALPMECGDSGRLHVDSGRRRLAGGRDWAHARAGALGTAWLSILLGK
jgi:hypothetical protein